MGGLFVPNNRQEAGILAAQMGTASGVGCEKYGART